MTEIYPGSTRILVMCLCFHRGEGGSTLMISIPLGHNIVFLGIIILWGYICSCIRIHNDSRMVKNLSQHTGQWSGMEKNMQKGFDSLVYCDLWYETRSLVLELKIMESGG